MIRIVWMVPFAATLLVATTSSEAGPCTAGIAQLEAEVRASRSDPNAGPSAPQSLFAQLEHQPTPETVAKAEAEARAGFEALVARAKELDAENDPGCAEVLAKARLVYFQ